MFKMLKMFYRSLRSLDVNDEDENDYFYQAKRYNKRSDITSVAI